MARSIYDDDIHEEEQGDGARSRPMKASLLAVLVVLAAVAGALIYFTSGEGNVTAVTLTIPSRSQDQLTFAYTIAVDRGTATGTGTFSATYKGEVTFERPVTSTTGGGRIDVRLGDFAVGNGEYTFKFAYKGRTASSTANMDFLVTSVKLWTTTLFDAAGRGTIRATANLIADETTGDYTQGPAGSNVSFQVLKNGFPDGMPVVRGAADRATVALNLTPSLGPGNYTVQLTFTNKWVKNDSAIATLGDTNATFVHNRPVACVNPSTYHANNANSYNVTIDAGCSTDDETIVDYTWYFGDGTDPVSSGSVPTEGHTYPASVSLRTYSGNVIVTDNRGESSEKPFTVTVSFS